MAPENWEEETDCEAPSEGQVFCTNNCGYFGSPATMNMCCKCYEDLVRLQSDGQTKTSLEVASANNDFSGLVAGKSPHSRHMVNSKIENPTPAPSQDFQKGIATSEGVGCSQPPPSKLVNRCFWCRKRVGLTGFKCKCGDLFCALHRYCEEHGCSFDYKSVGRDAIAKANPLIKAEKIQKL